MPTVTLMLQFTLKMALSLKNPNCILKDISVLFFIFIYSYRILSHPIMLLIILHGISAEQFTINMSYQESETFRFVTSNSFKIIIRRITKMQYGYTCIQQTVHIVLTLIWLHSAYSKQFI